jgi:hypothetical protein
MEIESPRSADQPTISLTESLGADSGVAAQCLTVYIPNKDQHDQEIGTQRRWVLDAIQLPLRDQRRRYGDLGRRRLAQRRRQNHSGTSSDRLFLRAPS